MSRVSRVVGWVFSVVFFVPIILAYARSLLQSLADINFLKYLVYIEGSVLLIRMQERILQRGRVCEFVP